MYITCISPRSTNACLLPLSAFSSRQDPFPCPPSAFTQTSPTPGSPPSPPLSLRSRQQNPRATHKQGSSSSAGCEFHRGAVSPRPQGPRRCPQDPRPRVLPSCWPPPTRSSAGTSRPSGGTCKAAHRSSGERGPRQTSLGSRKPVLGVSGSVTEHKHLASPGTRGARALWAETGEPSSTISHGHGRANAHIPTASPARGVGTRLIQHCPKGRQPKHLSAGVRTRQRRYIHSSQPHSNQRADRHVPDDRAQPPTHASEKKPDCGVHAASQHGCEAPEQLICTGGRKGSGCLGDSEGRCPGELPGGWICSVS